MQVSSFLIFSLVLSGFLYTSNKIKKKLLKRKNRNVAYVRTRAKVADYLNEKEGEANISRFENIVRIAKCIIVQRLRNTSTKQCCQPQQVCKGEEALKNVFESLINDFHAKDVNQKHLIKALRFQLKSETMKHPYDLVRSRRAFVMLEILHSVWNKENSEELHPTPIPETHFLVKLESQLYLSSSNLRLILISTVYVGLTFFLSYFYEK